MCYAVFLLRCWFFLSKDGKREKGTSMSEQKKMMIIITPIVLLVICLLAFGLSGCSDAAASTDGASETQEKAQEKTQMDSYSLFYQVYDISEIMESGEMGLAVLSSKDIYPSGFGSYVLVDPQTGVMYSYVFGDTKAGLTVLLNPDGTPRIYQPQDQ